MTLTAPEHLRGRISNHHHHLLTERAAWIKQAYAHGMSIKDISAALGICYNAAREAALKAGWRRDDQQRLKTLCAQGIILGKSGEAYDSLPIPARKLLADTAAKQRKPMMRVLADFWAQHHGAGA